MNKLLDELKSLISKHKLFENAIIFNGIDPPYISLEVAKCIYHKELQKKIRDKICDINEQIEVAEEELDSIQKDTLISQRKKIRALKDYLPEKVNTIDDLKFPSELMVNYEHFRRC